MAKKGNTKGPAQPVSKHHSVRKVEAAARGFNHLQKVLLENPDDDATIAAAVRELTPRDADPWGSSFVQSGEIQDFIDPAVDRGEKFKHPRQPGALDALGVVLKEIVAKYPGVSNKDAWEKLRVLAGPDHPVVQEVTEEHIYYLSGGRDRSVGRKGFADRMTRVRRLRK